jgi:hypothetical protein
MVVCICIYFRTFSGEIHTCFSPGTDKIDKAEKKWLASDASSAKTKSTITNIIRVITFIKGWTYISYLYLLSALMIRTKTLLLSSYKSITTNVKCDISNSNAYVKHIYKMSTWT